MNYLQKKQTNKDLMSMFTKNYPEGCSKTQGSLGESIEHYLVKSAVLHWLKTQGYDVWTESRLKDGSRPDIIAIKGHIGYILEIIHSETEKKFMAKMEKAYGEFQVIPVFTENFQYNTFCI